MKIIISITSFILLSVSAVFSVADEPVISVEMFGNAVQVLASTKNPDELVGRDSEQFFVKNVQKLASALATKNIRLNECAATYLASKFESIAVTLADPDLRDEAENRARKIIEEIRKNIEKIDPKKIERTKKGQDTNWFRTLIWPVVRSLGS